MGSFLLAILDNIRKYKTEHFVAGFFLFISSLFFCTALGVSNIAAAFIDIVYDNNNLSHLFFRVNKWHNTDEIVKWWNEQEGVDSVVSYKMEMIFRLFHIDQNNNKKKIVDPRINLYITEKTRNKYNQDKLVIVKAQFPITPAKDNFPDENTIWIPLQYAKTFQIELGETLTFSLLGDDRSFVVTAFTNDIFSDYNFFWIKEGSFDKMSNNNSPLPNEGMIGVRLNDTSKLDSLFLKFNLYIKDIITYLISYKNEKINYPFFHRVTSIILISLAVMFIIISIILLIGNFRHFLLSDMKKNVTLRSLGYTPFNIISTYTIQYFIISIVCVIPGIISSYFILQFITSSIIDKWQLSSLPLNFVLPALYTFFLLIGIIILVLYLFVKKEVSPAPSCIKKQKQNSRSNKRKRLFTLKLSDWVSPSLFFGIKNLLQNKKRIVLTLLCFSFSIMLTTILFNGTKFLKNSMNDMAVWGGFNSDIELIVDYNLPTTEAINNINNILKKNKDIKSVFTLIWMGYQRILINETAVDIYLQGQSSDLIDETGLNEIIGRHPREKAEVCISNRFSKDFDKNIGDTININIGGWNSDFLITGIFLTEHAFFTNSYPVRIASQKLNEMHPTLDFNCHFIILKNKEKKLDCINWIKTELGDNVEVMEKSWFYRFINSLYRSMFPSITGFFAILILCLLVLSFISVLNNTTICIKEQRRGFAILKAIGMTNNQLQTPLIWKNLIQMILALIISIPVACLITPAIVRFVYSSIGIFKVPFIVHVEGILISIPSFLIFAVLSTIIPSRYLLKIKPKVLIADS